MQRRLDP